MSAKNASSESALDPDEDLAGQLALIETELRRLAEAHRVDVSGVHPAHTWDALNLIHYVALRHRDERRLQWQLTRRGLSSLGRCEPHVLAAVNATMSALRGERPVFDPDVLDFASGRAALDANTDGLFGPRPAGRVTRIMVTLPSEAADDRALVRRLVAGGMDIARINGAHDCPEAWRRMADNVRSAAAEVGVECRIAIDLPGPKLRTGEIEQGPRVMRLRPVRDLRGVPITPAVCRLIAAGVSAGTELPAVPVDASWLARRRSGESITFRDTRGSMRTMEIIEHSPLASTAQVVDTTYLETGLVLSVGADQTTVGLLPRLPCHHVLLVGDRLVVCRDKSPQPAWRHGQPGGSPGALLA